MRKRICIACGAQLSKAPLLKLCDMPAAAQEIPGEDEVGEDHGISLSLFQCPFCGLVQFDCEPVGYYRDVIRSGGFTTTMMELRRRQYQHFIDMCHLEGKTIIEAGCGQGEFLSALDGFFVRAYGIEHRNELVNLARGRGLSVWRQFPETPDTILQSPDGEAKPPYDAFLSFNFLEHQPDPVGMLQCISNNLSEDGVGLVTVPSLEYILQYNGYYELIRDHLAYYTFDTLRFVLKRAGFAVIEEEIVNRDTLSVIVKKERGDCGNVSGWSGFGTEAPAGKESVDVSGLLDSVAVIGRETRRLMEELRDRQESLAIWGASHQGFTLAATTKLGGQVEYMIDSAPFKQGRFAPASHIPIVAPDYYLTHPVDNILIVAPGYTDEIAGIIREKFKESVKIFTLRRSHIEKL